MPHSADYALQIAMRMERLGLTFYESMAAGAGNAPIAAVAIMLAEQEKHHLWTFEKMYHSLPLEQCGPKLTEDQITAAAGKFYKLILPTADEVRQVALSGDTAKALQMAMQMEADSVAFYSNMTPAVKSDIAVLQAIIEEEKKHLGVLHGYLDHLGKPVPKAAR
ncbi:MAG: ferritin family protein [Sedimentisphaerales bacterium]|jgi:rubrerythrin